MTNKISGDLNIFFFFFLFSEWINKLKQWNKYVLYSEQFMPANMESNKHLTGIHALPQHEM